MSIIGVERYGLPSEERGTIDVTVVLFLGPDNDVACYRGCGTPEWVSAYGDQVTFEDAVKHFPFLRRELEDRGHTFAGRRFEPPCAECGATEYGRLVGCHDCGRRVCIDNCIAATDHEHGVAWCEACVEAAGSQ